jgi:N-hydroxyarylamine O-acetyltransferase
MMFDAPIDLGAYFGRIGYEGPRTAELSTLRALHVLHPAAIPFEAVDVLLGRGVDLSPAAVDAKLITARRGGYCFEHNSLFGRVLRALGFEVEGRIARVVWMASPEAPVTSRTHMALQVMADGEPWWVDVGFGGCVLTEPLRLIYDEPQRTTHEPFRLRRVDRNIGVDIKLGETWTPTYIADVDPPVWADYEAGNWWTSAHPSSLFRNNLLVARTTGEARFTLLNNRLTVRRVDGSVSQQELDADGLGSVLADTFGLPVEADWRPALEKAAQAAP